MNAENKKKRSGETLFKNIIVFFLVGFFLIPFASSIPTPLGIDGTVFELDGITPVRNGIDFSVTNLNNGEIVTGKTGRGSPGRYSSTVGGNNGNTLLISAWNKYNSANFTIAANGVIHNAHFVLNTTYPPLAPIITTAQLPPATEKVPYVFAIEALDENEDMLTFTLLGGPEGMMIDYGAGTIEWTPTNNDVGNRSFSVGVSDGVHITNATFLIEVQGVNDAPVITSTPPTNAFLGQEYAYQASAYDAENDPLSFALVEAPSNAELESASGMLRWKPTGNQKGDNHFAIKVDDGVFSSTQVFTVVVSLPSAPEKGGSSGGGGGGASGAPGKPDKQNKAPNQGQNQDVKTPLQLKNLLSEEELAIILAKLRAQDVLVLPDQQNSIVSILTQRPQQVVPLQSKVYKYLQIENQNQAEQPSHLISFRLGKSWLAESSLKPDDISMRRYVDGEWTHLATSPVSEDESYAYYLAETPGFSYFAITVKEGIAPAYSFKPDISSFKLPYTIVGTAFSFGRLKQVQHGIPMTLENLNTSERLEFPTGAGSYGGAYVGTLVGEPGQVVKVTLDATSTLIILGDDSIIIVDFVKRLFGKGYVAVQRESAFYRVLSSLFTLFLIMSLALLITVMLQRRFEKERQKRQKTTGLQGELSEAQQKKSP